MLTFIQTSVTSKVLKASISFVPIIKKKPSYCFI